jgi:hypothetical protein
VAKASALLTVVAEMKRLLGCRAAQSCGCENKPFSALALIPAVARPLARLPDRASVGMGTIEPGTGNIIQHAREAATAPILLDVRARTALPFAAALRIVDGRQGNDPCRKYGEDQFPHDHSPNSSTPPH